MSSQRCGLKPGSRSLISFAVLPLNDRGRGLCKRGEEDRKPEALSLPMKKEPLERSFTVKFLHCLGSSSFADAVLTWSPFMKHIPYACHGVIPSFMQ